MPVRRRTTIVARRALDALIGTQTANDLYRLEEVAAQEGEDFSVAYIDADFTFHHSHEFAPDYMKRLFEHGYALGAYGDP
jgi:hypothetical protein